MIDTVDFTTPGFVAPMSEREQFFYDHAGYGYDPKRETPEEGRVRCARALADAEREGKARGWQVTWEEDEYTSFDDDVERETEDYSQWVATLYDEDGELLDALGGIDIGPEPYQGYNMVPARWVDGVKVPEPYCRVIEAELMLGALS